MPRSDSKKAKAARKSIVTRSGQSDDWQDVLVSEFRRLIEEADPSAVEQQKWKKPSNPEGVPVWYHDGIICLVGQLKGRVRLTFPEGASLKDPRGLFNACLDAGHMRGIDVYEGKAIDAEGVKVLVRASVRLNESAARDQL
jgi:hypothetical protein